MHMSPQGRRSLVEAFEGVSLKAYKDCVGVLTIGYGHTSSAGKPTVTVGWTITQAQADSILSNDLAKFEASVAALLKKPASQDEFDAMVDLTFNVGTGNFKSSTLLRKFNAGDKSGAAKAFASWNRAGGRVVAGLTRRRRAETLWFLGQTVGAPVAFAALPDFDPMAHGLHDHPDSYFARAVNRVVLALT